MAQGRDGWPGKAAVSDSTRGSPQRERLKSAPEWVVGLSLPTSSLLLCPLPSWLSFQQWGSRCQLSVHRSAGRSFTLQSGWKLELQVTAQHTVAFASAMPLPLRSEPGRYCVLSWRDCGSRLPPFSPFPPVGSPKGGSQVGLRALAGAAFSICSFLGNQGRCRCPYDVAGK